MKLPLFASALVLAAVVSARPQATTPDPKEVAQLEEVFSKLDPNLTLATVEERHVDEFMKNKLAVNRLVTCFESLRRCKNRAGASLVRDVQRLTARATCEHCEPEEEERRRKLVLGALGKLQQAHPKEWRRLIPNIGFLL